MAFFAHGSGGTGRFLEWKVRLFFVAAVLLLVGMAREVDLLVLLAIVVLALAFVLRFFERPKPVDEEAEDEEAEEDDAETEAR